MLIPVARIALAVVTIVTMLLVPVRAEDAFSADEKGAIVKIVEDGMAAQRQPGLVVGIWIPGRGEFVQALGVSDIAAKTPMKADDHIRIASITKSFVAVAALRLVDQGKLKLDDTLATWIDGIPNGETITIRQLLGMQSGIYDFTSDKQFLSDFTADPLMAFSPNEVVAIVKRHEPDFAPGEKTVYCDTNYIFLGIIIEKVTGRPVEDVIREEILAPLGMKETSFPITSVMPQPFAHGYYAGEDGKGELRDYTASNPEVAWSAGAMISTLSDLRIWAHALATGRLLRPETHAEQMKFGVLATKPFLIGYGLGIANFGGMIGHNGAIFGYTTAMFYIPGADATFIVAGNLASNFSNSATEIAYALAKRLLPDRVE